MAWELFKQIQKDLANDLKIDRMNIGEMSMKAPAIKHFWIAKLIQFKIDILELEKEKKNLLNMFLENKQEIGMKKDSLVKDFNARPKIKEMNSKLEELNVIVEYLTDAKFVLGRITDDIKNRIELEKVERL